MALPAFSCYDLVSAAVGAGVRMVFYDLDPLTLSPDMDSFDRALAAEPQGGGRGQSIRVSGGLDAPFGPGAGKGGPVLIEDAAQGLGSSFEGRGGGTFGDLTVLSFSRGKGWTGGGGGALLFRGGREAAVGGGPEGGGRVEGRRHFLGPASSRVGPDCIGIPNALPGLQLGETHFQEAVPPHGIRRFSAGLAFPHGGPGPGRGGGQEGQRRKAPVVLGEDGWKEVLRLPSPLQGVSASYLRLPVVLEASLRARPLDRELSRWGVAGSYPLALPNLPEGKKLKIQTEERFPGSRNFGLQTPHLSHTFPP